MNIDEYETSNPAGDKEKFVPPKDGSWVPRDRMNEAVENAVGKVSKELETERESRIRLEEQMRVLQQTPAAPVQAQQLAPVAKTYTLAELRLAVEKETISQDQADLVWEKQQNEKVDQRVKQTLDNFTIQTTSNAAVDSGLQAYLDALPDLNKDGADERKKVTAAYNSLTAVLGVPKVAGSVEDKQIQLAALNNCYGSVAALRQKQLNDKDTLEHRDTHQESVGDAEPASAKDAKFVKSLTAAKRAYYTRMIASNQYTGWGQVEAEMKYARK